MNEDRKTVKSAEKSNGKKTKLGKFFGFLRFVKKYLYSVFFPYEKHGNLTKYNQGGLIIIGNHYSLLDVAYPLDVTDRPIHFVAKSELWDKKGTMRKFVETCECIPAKRDGTDVQAIKESLRVLKSGGAIAIFPEGTRNTSYSDLLPFKGGAAALSIKTQTPIIPVVKVTKPKLFKKIHVIYGDPIEFRRFYGKKTTKEEIDECDNVLREAMKNMRAAFIEKYNYKIKSDKV